MADSSARTEIKTENVTVLIVEDEQSVMETYKLYTETEGYTVLTASNGGEALVEIGDEVDVVLLDRRMPGMSGDEVLAHIRKWEMDCRVVMVTAVDPDVDVIKMGFDDYLTKPVSKDDILDTIEQLLLFDRYEALLDEYHTKTKAYATLKANADGGDDADTVEQLDEERRQLRQDILQTVDSFTDDEIAEVFLQQHN